LIVIGAGRVGGALAERAAVGDEPVVLIDREHGWEALDGPQGDPILVATRNDDIADVVSKVPSGRRADLVFLQNGVLQTYLREAGLGRCTRGLLYFAVPSRGAPIEVGGTSWFSGPHALAVVRWLAGLGVRAEEVDWPRFTFFELEKATWLIVNGLLCERHGATVGEVATQHRSELEAVVAEVQRVGRASLGVDVPPEYLAGKVCAYSATIPDYRASVKEWGWRNGWLVAQAQRFGMATPLHDALTHVTGHGHELAEFEN
jgi:ketopantoate reductase